MYDVGLIGHGNFGKLLQQSLNDYCNFAIYDPLSHPDNLSKALAQPVIILAVPAQHLTTFLETNKASLNKTAIYIDVCSVKLRPVAAMLKYLPEQAEIIATHPLFGPNTLDDEINGRRIMTYPVRVTNQRYVEFKQYLTRLGLEIIEVTPDEHDRAMAYVQGMSHYVGRIMQTLNIPETLLATRAYKDLIDMKNIQGKDSPALFQSIISANPYVAAVMQEFDAARDQVDKEFGL